MKEVKKVYVRAEFVLCPYCGERQEGWMKDPRGVEERCDDCREYYKVSKGAEIKFY